MPLIPAVLWPKSLFEGDFQKLRFIIHKLIPLEPEYLFVLFFIQSFHKHMEHNYLPDVLLGAGDVKMSKTQLPENALDVKALVMSCSRFLCDLTCLPQHFDFLSRGSWVPSLLMG